MDRAYLLNDKPMNYVKSKSPTFYQFAKDFGSILFSFAWRPVAITMNFITMASVKKIPLSIEI